MIKVLYLNNIKPSFKYYHEIYNKKKIVFKC